METPPIACPYSFQIIVRQNVAVAKESEAFLGGLFGRSRFKLVKHRFAMDLKECVGRDERQYREAFVFQFLLDGTDDYPELARARPPLM